MINIAFVTGHVFGCTALKGIIDSAPFKQKHIHVSLVVGLSEKFRTNTVGFQSPEYLAKLINSQYVSVEDGTLSGISDLLAGADIDYLLVIGWSRIIPKEILNIPRKKIDGNYGAIGMHPTLLPTGRGRAPIPWTIIKGLKKTGLTVFSLFEKPDCGNIIAQYPICVDEQETSSSLFDKFIELHYSAGMNLSQNLMAGVWCSTVQDERFASQWIKRIPKDSRLDSRFSFKEAESLIRAQQPPYPQASILLDNLWQPVCKIFKEPQQHSHQNVLVQFKDGSYFVKLEHPCSAHVISNS